MFGLFQKEKKIFVITVIVFSIYAGCFLYKSCFDIFGERYFSLFDDAMISMTYAKNFVYGHGLVWNPGGERVEGFTNPLWVLYMALFHLLPVPLSKLSLFIQISGAVFLLINLYYIRKIALFISPDSSVVSSGAVILTAFYYPLIYWSLMGLEVSILTLLMSIFVWKVIEYLKNDVFPAWLYIIMGLSTFIRIDMAVPFISIFIFLILAKPAHRTKNLIWGFLVFAFFMGAQTLFRWIYFHDIFPNTYYLKMTGYPVLLRLTRGLYVFVQFIGKMNFLLFLLPFVALAYNRNTYKSFLTWIIITQFFYSIYVGGDSWENWGGSNRFISIIMPLFFVQFSHALVNLMKIVFDTIKSTKSLSQKARSSSLKFAFPVIFFLSIIQFNGYALSEFFLLVPPNQVNINKEMAHRAVIIKEVTEPDATVALTCAGVIPYFSERIGVDVLGKCDRVISHQKARISTELSKFMQFQPGHSKWDIDYSLGKQKPDIITHLWGGGREEAAPYLHKNYYFMYIAANDAENANYEFWFRTDSKKILWDKIPGVK